MGRSSQYTPEIGNVICERLAAGESLCHICKDDNLPARSTVVGWAENFPDFREQYARARREGLDVIADDIVAISDDLTDDPQSRRVRVDSRKWLLSKMRPDKYGERSSLDLNAKVDGKLNVDANGVETLLSRIHSIAAAESARSSDPKPE